MVREHGHREHDHRERRRRGRAAVLAGVAVLALAACGSAAPVDAAPAPTTETATATGTATAAAAPGAPAGQAEARAAEVAPSATADGPPSDRRRFVRRDRITGALTPKSVVASGTGLVVAQNMIYTHTVSAYSSDGELLATVPDAVVPADHGYPQWTSQVRGGPVEAAFSPDGESVWVSNYSMYGPGFGAPGDDTCGPASGIDDSFLYRIGADSLQVEDAVLVGSVPKYVAVTRDGRYVLVTNWCDYDLSVVDTTADGGPREVARVPIGRYPRGIETSPDSRTAYVAVMGGSEVLAVDLAAAASGAGEAAVVRRIGVGRGPRHLNLFPDGSTLFVTLNQEGRVAKVDLPSGRVVGTVATGRAPRSAVLSPDGTALFVANYSSDTVSRVRTADLAVLETVDVDHHPIGITYDAATSRVWVAAYVGSLTVFDDAPAPGR
jgi:YVTN family beta-propeller protein